MREFERDSEEDGEGKGSVYLSDCGMNLKGYTDVSGFEVMG
jgi:hypothetical protein